MLKPSLSIIIIAHNNPSIYDCIEHLKSQIDEYDEIILVDDHSTEDYFTSVKDYCDINKIVLLQSIKRGNRASNRNLGASKARNPILLFVDADMLLFQTSIPAIKKAYLTQEHIPEYIIRHLQLQIQKVQSKNIFPNCSLQYI